MLFSNDLLDICENNTIYYNSQQSRVYVCRFYAERLLLVDNHI